MKPQALAALETVARRFSATLEKGRSTRSAQLTIGRKRVALDFAMLNSRKESRTAKPRLRFDKVVIRLMKHLTEALAEIGPDSTTVALTVTAPIRLAAKTATALTEKIQTLLVRRVTARDVSATIHGNRVRIRVLKGAFNGAPKLIGFVHSSDTNPLLLLDMTRELLEVFSGKPTRATQGGGERWLMVCSARGSECLDAYRYIYSQLNVAHGFEKVLIAFDDGRVEAL